MSMVKKKAGGANGIIMESCFTLFHTQMTD